MIRSIIGMAAALLVISAAHGQQLQPAPDVPAGFLQLDENQVPARNAGRQLYIVKLAGDPAVVYDGGEPGFAATKPRKGGRYNASASHVQQYTSHLKQKHDQKLASIGAADRKVYSYTHTMNGFAAMLTAAEAEKLKGDKSVVDVYEDYAMELDTNNSPTFLGLTDKRVGLHDRLQLKGEDVIVGILDTGAIQEHPSFSDTAVVNKTTKVVYGPPPARWNGVCQPGEAWSEEDCNNKLIGARWYVDGFIAGRGSVVDGEFLSPRDSSGHGSHTASTAAGNPVTATLNGTPVAEISGMAPRARVAVYKVCWLSPGATNFSCFFSDTAAATDAAVADGVDVLNFSVGTAAAFNDPQDIAFLFAADAGVFVARSAGNSGPGFGSTPAGEPWVTSVGASTLSGTGFALAATINSPASVAGDYTALEGAITGSLTELGPVTDDLVAADPIDACTPLENDIGGKIALIARGACTFTSKIENAVLAGASAVLMYTDNRPKTVMGGTTTPLTSSIPGVMIDNAPGLAILAELEAGSTVNATLSAGNFTTEELEGNIMAGFSSRGPYLTETDWLKPDITAPGVRILAAYSPDQSDGSGGDVFAYLQGTSMSSPHIAGLGALVKQAHPDWSAAQIKSALMTTARQDVVKEDGTTPADPFDFGAGHVDPNGAVDPGLTFDAGFFDYLAASCGTATPLVSAGFCDLLKSVGFSLEPADLNLPSIAIGELPGTQTVTRTVTAVRGYKGPHGFYADNDPRQYTAVVEAPPGFDVQVSPSTLYLRNGESASYEVTITSVDAPPREWRFGSLTWVGDGERDVRSPIAVNAVAIVAPESLSQTGPSGADSFDITFGYTGDYTAGVHGLNDAGLTLSTVEDDPNNGFVFLGPGTTIAFFAEVPDGTAFARWSLFNEYTTGNDDIDLYLYYCPNLLCSQVDSSGNPDSNEEVNALLPANDPSIFDPYVLFLHGFETDGKLPADVISFDWKFGVVDDAGNLTLTQAPGAATIGATETIAFEWAGLGEGLAAKQLGAISHSDADGIQALTLIDVTNDTGSTIFDFCAFIPSLPFCPAP